MKYMYLQKYLSQKAAITLTYTEIEQILGFALPEAAYKHRSWWGNDPSTTQSHAWLSAGWHVSDVELGISVTFIRSGR
ncbi:DUF7662 domain-containing protein [Paenibacillus sp. GYB003]|uniref:DUF7662 domain-containing protein n=1 Tax=Paenibacillus sp. GYB003 TaxID=2994392 RepID=UPI002F96CD61